MVERGEIRILFDPLFRYPHDYYQSVPPETEAAILSGSAPFEGIDAVFISHFHADHFSAELIMQMLVNQPGITLFAPGQAVSALYGVAPDDGQEIFERIKRIDLAYGDAPVSFELGKQLIEAVMIPHSGWPNTHRHVENLSFRVTLDEATTVVHMGDADARIRHFEQHQDYWNERQADAAFPPYWFFLSDSGRLVLDQHIRPAAAVGLHIPADVEQREAELAEFDVFTEPGESRDIPDRQ